MTLIDICRDDGGFDATAGDVLDKVNAKASDTAIAVESIGQATPKVMQ